MSDPNKSFQQRLALAVESRESQIVLGLDPSPAALWPQIAETAQIEQSQQPTAAAAEAIAAQCEALIAAVGESCVAVKPQLACFERLGSAGWRALERACEAAQAAGLLVIADGKRGDVPVTAQAYGEALGGGFNLGSVALGGLKADAATLNPLLGVDSLQPPIEQLGSSGAGTFLLVRTSNPGAADVQDLQLSSGQPLWQRVAQMVAELAASRVDQTGLSDVGAVVGATVPEHLAKARELMPHSIFLLPGVGAQGGRIEDLAPAFAPAPAAGLVAASRSIATAYLQSGGDPAAAAKAESERLRELAWSLR